MQSTLLNTLSNHLINDEQIRARALDPTASFIVQAPAGSGKTGLLTQRFLVLLSVAEVNPEECLAITFTRKAASEMRDRILAALETAQNPIPPADPYEQKIWRLGRAVLERDKTLGWDLLHNPNRLKIQTIDAFCASITRQMPVLSGFGATPRIIEDPTDLYQLAAKNLLKALETNDRWSTPCRVLLSHLDNNLFLAMRLLADMLSHRDQWLPYIGQTFTMAEQQIRCVLEAGLETVVCEALTALVAAMPVDVVFEEIFTLAEIAAFELERLNIISDILHCRTLEGKRPSDKLHDLPKWQGLAELLLTQENTLRKTVTKQQGFPAPNSAIHKTDKQAFKSRKERMTLVLKAIEQQPVFLEKLRLLRECPPITYTDDQWGVVWALIQLLPILTAELALVFEENNTVDFTEITLAALKALGDSENPTDLALGLDYKIRHILIDEFQDTSLSQFRLLEQLTAGWQPTDGRTLFLVGDPMQSIYRFRQAEVGLFIRAKQRGVGNIILNALTLTSNFRSDPELVEWANVFFKTQFPSHDDITASAIAFSASQSVRLGGQGAIAKMLSVTKETESVIVVDLIKTIKETDPTGSIALIVRSRRHLVDLLPQLRAAKIPYEGIQLETLAERPIVQDLLALTRALLHLGDRIAWLAILRAPWCELSLKDLFLIANAEPTLPIWHTLQSYLNISELSETGKYQLSILIPVLSEALSNAHRVSLRTWIMNTWRLLGGMEKLYAFQNIQDNIQDIEAFFSLLDRVEVEGEYETVGVLEQKVASLYATTSKNHIPDDQLQNNPVQIMTIHKAKGLEFDTVIVPGMGKKTMRDASRLLLWEERVGLLKNSYFMMAPIKRVGNAIDPVYHYLKQQEERRDAYEAHRLGYVAATRARKRLYWLTQISVDTGK